MQKLTGLPRLSIYLVPAAPIDAQIKPSGFEHRIQLMFPEGYVSFVTDLHTLPAAERSAFRLMMQSSPDKVQSASGSGSGYRRLAIVAGKKGDPMIHLMINAGDGKVFQIPGVGLRVDPSVTLEVYNSPSLMHTDTDTDDDDADEDALDPDED
jgi:hypothetical protein